jgi:hypothetical protein
MGDDAARQPTMSMPLPAMLPQRATRYRLPEIINPGQLQAVVVAAGADVVVT